MDDNINLSLCPVDVEVLSNQSSMEAKERAAVIKLGKLSAQEQVTLRFMKTEEDVEQVDAAPTGGWREKFFLGCPSVQRPNPSPDHHHDTVFMSCSAIQMESRKEDFKHVKTSDDLSILNLKHKMNIRQSHNTVCMADGSLLESARITIYQYKTTSIGQFQGIPVALNFTDSDRFIKCRGSGAMVEVIVESCEKVKLTHISGRDEELLPFIFFMKGRQDRSRCFESAKYSGYFMKAVTENLTMGTLSPESESSYFELQ